MFSPTILYIKTHTVTGMQYFGKTCSLDRVSRYWGSGRTWRKHLTENGKTFTTQIVGFYLDKERCRQAALKFSKDNNIVKSPLWANEVIENGLSGMAYNAKLKPRTEEQRKAQCKPRGPYGPHKVVSPKKGKPTGKRPTNADTVRTCPHCQHAGKGPNMFRYHFKNCKGFIDATLI
jgi:hypothetical protein